MNNVLGIDLGTSSVKVLQRFFDGSVKKVRVGYESTDLPGWREAIREALRQLDTAETTAIGLSSQVGTYIIDEASVICWQDAAGKEELQELCSRYTPEEFIQEISMPHPQIISYPLPRLKYIKKHFPQARSVCQPKDAIVKMLTGSCVTDPYSWRGLVNLQTGRYSGKFLRELGVSEQMLPPVIGCREQAGLVTREAAQEFSLPAGIPVYAGLNDYFASLLGMGICRPGRLFDITGTSEHLGILETVLRKDTGLVSGPYLSGFVHYGVTASSGASLYFGSRLSPEPLPLEEALQGQPPVFLPYLKGERSPVWDPAARGVFFGLTESSDSRELAYSVLEGVAFSLYHIYETMGCPAAEAMVISGGAADSQLLCSIKAELFGIPAVLLKEADTSALGACMVALMGQGMDLEEATQLCVRAEKTVVPSGKYREKLHKRYEIYKSLYPALKEQFAQLGEV